MRLIEIFYSQEKKRNLSHIKNLIAIAFIDGDIDDRELDLISKIATKRNISSKDFNRIIERPSSIDFKIPSDDKEKIAQLYDMVFIMMADGNLHDKEIKLCKVFAIKLGFKSQVIDKILENITDMILKNLATEIAINELLKIIRK